MRKPLILAANGWRAKLIGKITKNTGAYMKVVSGFTISGCLEHGQCAKGFSSTGRPCRLHMLAIFTLDILYTLTEILRFVVGLAQGGIFDSSAFLSIQLHNTHDYMLYESFERFFPHEYVNQSDTPIEQQQGMPVGQLAAIADQIALDMTVKVLSAFDWVPGEAAIRTLAEDQKKLVERRL